jgi:triosephosphate isomerase
MTRKPMIAGNWKMNKDIVEATKLTQQISYSYLDDYDGVDIVLCPPFTDLRSVQVTLGFDKSEIKIGAQDVYWQPNGAYTGAISTEMLKSLDCRYCIIGHSERRQYFAESDEMVNLKAKALLGAGISPIICCGESLEVREADKTLEHVVAQVRAALASVSPAEAEAVVVAYEPIWAIGSGRTPTPEQANQVCAAIRETLSELYGVGFAEAARILYGGSLNPGNVDLFKVMPDIDGGLIGGAALVATDFMQLVKAFS